MISRMPKTPSGVYTLYMIHVRPTDLTNTARTNNPKRLAGGLTAGPVEF